MRTLLVYCYLSQYYAVLIGESCAFKDKSMVFSTGKEREIFRISIAKDTPFMALLRSMIAEADKRGIRDIQGLEDCLCRASQNVVVALPPSHSPSKN